MHVDLRLILTQNLRTSTYWHHRRHIISHRIIIGPGTLQIERVGASWQTKTGGSLSIPSLGNILW